MKLYKVKVDTYGNKTSVYVACKTMSQLEDLIHEKISHDTDILECVMIADEESFFIELGFGHD